MLTSDAPLDADSAKPSTTARRRVEGLRRGLVLVAIIAACRPEARPEAPSSDPDSTPVSPVAPSQATDPSAPWAGPLVAGGAALVQLDDRGQLVETLATREAIRPRWLVPGQSLLFLRHQEQDGRWQLVRLDLPSRAETVLVTDLVANGIDCPRSSSAPPPAADPDPDAMVDWLDVHVDEDFRVGGGLACVTFMDRNMNMANVRMQAKVRLDDRTVERRLEMNLSCEDEDEDTDTGDSAPFPECEVPEVSLMVSPPGGPEPTASGPYRVEEGRVLRRVDDRDELVAGPFPCVGDDGKPTTKGCPQGLPTFEPMASSPSGRWVVLWGNELEGDYLHWQWLLLDAHRGELFAIGEDTKAWPAPLTPAQLGALTYEAVGNGVVAETPMFWLAGDRLVIETLLILPGDAVVALPGYLVR